MNRYTVIVICLVLLTACDYSAKRNDKHAIIEKRGYLVTYSGRAETMYFLESASPRTQPLALHSIEVENAFAFSTNERLFSDLLRLDVLPDTFTLSLKDEKLRKSGWGRIMVAPVRIVYESDSVNCSSEWIASATEQFRIAGRNDSLVFDYDTPCIDVLKISQ